MIRSASGKLAQEKTAGPPVSKWQMRMQRTSDASTIKHDSGMMQSALTGFSRTDSHSSFKSGQGKLSESISLFQRSSDMFSPEPSRRPAFDQEVEGLSAIKELPEHTGAGDLRSVDSVESYRKARTRSIGTAVRKKSKSKTRRAYSQGGGVVDIKRVSALVKKKIWTWLMDVQLIKESIPFSVLRKLPHLCREGVIYFDLLNRLEGVRHEIIKGCERNPRSSTQVALNYQRVMNYLKQYEKMNPRYLNSSHLLMQGNSDVFYGFLDDIWHLYHHKISPNDPRFALSSMQSLSSLGFNASLDSLHASENADELLYMSLLEMRRSSKATPKGPRLDDEEEPLELTCSPSPLKNAVNSPQHEMPPLQQIELLPPMSSPLKTVTVDTGSYSALHERRKRLAHYRVDSYTTRPNRSSSRSQRKTVSRQNSYGSRLLCSVTLDVEEEVKHWLRTLGLRHLLDFAPQNHALFEDPFRNGLLLGAIIAQLWPQRMADVNLYRRPKAIDECEYNVETIFSVLRDVDVCIPAYLLDCGEAIIRGERGPTWELLVNLMNSTDSSMEKRKMQYCEPSRRGNTSSQRSVRVLQYTSKELSYLEEDLIRWMWDLGYFHSIGSKPTQFEDVWYLLRDGVLLADFMKGVTQGLAKIKTIHRKPTLEVQVKANFAQITAAIRSCRGLSDRYGWSANALYKGDKLVWLGFLEDLRHFADLLAKQQRSKMENSRVLQHLSAHPSFSMSLNTSKVMASTSGLNISNIFNQGH
jgi:hypothetical protein